MLNNFDIIKITYTMIDTSLKKSLSTLQSKTCKVLEVETVLKSNIYIFDLNNKIQADSIAMAVKKYRNNFPQSNKTYVRGWHSRFHTHLYSNDFDELIKEVESRLRPKLRKNCDCKVEECWTIMYEKGDKVDVHAHDAMQYSAVYYAYAQNSKTPLKFEGNIEIIPKTGQLLIFPGYLKHWVPVIEESDGRISVAFNISYLYKHNEK